MLRVLLKKELREHAKLLVVLFLFNASLISLVVAGDQIRRVAGSPFELFRSLLATSVIPMTWVLSHNLVSKEYRGRTQLFLEALPVRRDQVVTAKLLVGGFFLLALVQVDLAIFAALAARREPVDLTQVFILSARALSFTFFFFATFFALGFLGRYRVAILITTFLITAILIEQKGLSVFDFGPFRMLDTRFAYERRDLPLRQLGLTLFVGGAQIALAFFLALVKEGSVAALLAEPMSHREKTFIAASMLATLSVFGLVDQKAKKLPYRLSSSDVIRQESPSYSLQVSLGDVKHEIKARELAEELGSRLSLAAEYLNIEPLPPLFVIHRSDLDPEVFEAGQLPKNEGCLLRANLLDRRFDLDDFMPFALGQLLLLHSKNRLNLESRRWVLDAFGEYWLAQHGSPAMRERLMLRALYATGEPFEGSPFLRWLSYREARGSDLASAVAWSYLVTLEERLGEERLQAFLREVIGRPAPEDLRVSFSERSLDQIFLKEHKIQRGELDQRWREKLDHHRTQAEPQLRQLPRLQGAFFVSSPARLSRTIHHQVQLQNPREHLRLTVHHQEIGPVDQPIELERLVEEELEVSADGHGQIARSFSAGARIFAAFSLWIPELECRAFFGATRRNLD